MAIPLPPLSQPPPPAPRPLDAVLRFFPVLHVLSGAVLLFSPAFFVPIAFSLALADGAHAAFETGFLVTFVTGLFTFFVTRGRHRRELQPRERGTQLLCDTAEQALQTGDHPIEPRGHLIDRRTEGAEFIAQGIADRLDESLVHAQHQLVHVASGRRRAAPSGLSAPRGPRTK